VKSLVIQDFKQHHKILTNLFERTRNAQVAGSNPAISSGKSLIYQGFRRPGTVTQLGENGFWSPFGHETA